MCGAVVNFMEVDKELLQAPKKYPNYDLLGPLIVQDPKILKVQKE